MSISKQLNSIVSFDPNVTLQRRYMWLKHHEERSKFIKGLKEAGKKGKEYSALVAEFDKQFKGGL